ncbi:MAG: hypothetical protein JNK89_02570 [Saprospiraceae bacterium]|nr:hypothetical protein [Saprospiraceae bacterium]
MQNLLAKLLALWALVATLAFAYQPEEPACAIRLDKLNTFYVALDHPASILARGIPESELTIATSDNLSIRKEASGKYIVRASAVGPATITLSGGALPPTTFEYRVRGLPDPEARLGGSILPNNLPVGTFRAQQGLVAPITGFDMSGSYGMVGYKVVQVRGGKFLAEAENTGGRFNEAARRLIDDAQPGDVFIFENIKVQMPGETAPRAANSLTFSIL